MQPTTLALGGAAAVGVAFLLSRATGEEEEEDIPRGPGTTPMDIQPPEPSAPPMPSSTVEEWRRTQEENQDPTNIQDPVELITPDPDKPQEVRGTTSWSALDYAKATGGVVLGAAAIAGGAVAYNEYSKDQAYVHPDGPLDALALEEAWMRDG